MKKKIIKIQLAFALLFLTGCYDKYVMDYDYSAAYVAYQYDLRTFVIGEGMKFNFTVAFAGSVENSRDRAVEVAIDDDLVTGDLSVFSGSQDVESFTALDGLLGKAPFGLLSQSYVTKEVTAQNLSAMTPLPAAYYNVSDMENLTIKKGRHTTTVTISATDEILGDDKSLQPYYALGFKILKADVDSLLTEKSFEIIAIKCEHKFWGNWYHGGKTVVKDNASGQIVSENEYVLELPQSDADVYALATVAADAVVTNKIGLETGSLKLTFNGDQIQVESADGSKTIEPIADKPSRFNGARLLQDRRLFLNYSYNNGDGTTTFITDTLMFRNRIRDGINEWQDENPENYQ